MNYQLLSVMLGIFSILGWVGFLIKLYEIKKFEERYEELIEGSMLQYSKILHSAMMVAIASELTVDKLAGEFIHPEVLRNTFMDFLRELDPEGTEDIDFDACIDEETKKKMEKYGLTKFFGGAR